MRHNEGCVLFLCLSLLAAAFAQQLWGVGSCQLVTPSPVSFSTINTNTGDFHIQFNSSSSMYPKLMVFTPERLTVDYTHKIIYSTAYYYDSSHPTIPEQVLVSGDPIGKKVSVALDDFLTSEANYTILSHLEWDRSTGQLFSVRWQVKENANNQNSYSLFLDVINPTTGIFKTLWKLEQFISVFGALNYSSNSLTFPVWNPYKTQEIDPDDDRRRATVTQVPVNFITLDLRSGSVTNNVTLDISSLVPRQPHNASYITSMHYDGVTQSILVTGNFPRNGTTGGGIWVGTFNPVTGVVLPRWSNAYRTPSGTPLVLYLGSAFSQDAGLLTMKLLDANGDLTQSRLITLNVRTWTVIGNAPFKITNSECILNIVYM